MSTRSELDEKGLTRASSADVADRPHTTKQMGDAGEMLVAADLDRRHQVEPDLPGQGAMVRL
jgi:hypothetical protein